MTTDALKAFKAASDPFSRAVASLGIEESPGELFYRTNLSTPDVYRAVSCGGVDVSVSSPLHTADSFGMAGHGK